MMGIKELENALLDQIEKLSDESIGDNPEETQRMIDRSKAMSSLAENYVDIQRLKLDAVKEMNSNGDLYAGYLGLEDNSQKKAVK